MPSPKKPISVAYLKNAVQCAAHALSAGLSGEKLLSLTSTRRNELNVLINFVRSCQELGRTEFFLVSGTPGVGKTFSMNQIMLSLKQENIAIPVYVNCFELDNARSIHEVILEAICQANDVSLRELLEKSQEQTTASRGNLPAFTRKNSQAILEKCCMNGWRGVRRKGDRRIMLLVLDEIDTLIVNNEQPMGIIFSILDLLRYAGSNLCVIGISNQVGIPALQESKLISRINGQLVFKSYTESELIDLVIGRMELFNGVITPAINEKVSAPARSSVSSKHKLDMFPLHALQVIFRKCGGVQGDARQIIHGCEHVLIHFLGRNDTEWKEILKKARQSKIFTSGEYDPEEGLIDTEFAFRAVEKFGSSVIHPELKSLPFLAFVVLAICRRILIIRSSTSSGPEATQNTATNLEGDRQDISIDTIAEAIYTIAARIRETVRQRELLHGSASSSEKSGMLTTDLADRIENYAGLQVVVQSLYQLRLIHIVSTFGDPSARGIIRLSVNLDVLRRALINPNYCPYVEILSMI